MTGDALVSMHFDALVSQVSMHLFPLQGLQLSLVHAYEPCFANNDCSGYNPKTLIYKLWLETFLKYIR